MEEKIVFEYAKLKPITDPESEYDGFEPGRVIIPKGYLYEEGRMPFPVDVLLDRDVAVRLRDGTTIYVDVYRPVDSDDNKVPALLNWGPAGKRGRNNMLDSLGGTPPEGYGDLILSYIKQGRDIDVRMGPPHVAKRRLGIPSDATTGLQAWECPDPAFYVARGYAMVNADPRGCYMSEGNVLHFGSLDAADMYDMVEFLAVQPWCTGKVGTCGASWYAMTQWCLAAGEEVPPHLAAIAPHEGEGDLYRDEYMRGGIPACDGTTNAAGRTFGAGSIEDIGAMIKKYPLMNSYWEDKRWKFENITVPVYEVASYSSQMHCRGALDGFRKISSENKWLRIHNTQEWVDMYSLAANNDLCRFFDKFLKGIDNGFEETPRVRLAVLDPGGVDQLCLPEDNFPPERTYYKKLYLNAETGLLDETPAQSEAVASYDSEHGACQVCFTYQFEHDTKIVGFPMIQFWCECEGYDDMDVFARLTKTDADGNPQFQNSVVFLYSGTEAKLRVSMRELDPELSTEYEPVQAFRRVQKLKAGEIVPVQTGFWPTGMQFHRGDKLELTLSGYDYSPNYPFDRPNKQPDNHGIHKYHCGGKFESYIAIPILPDK